MKKLIALMLAVMILLAMAACDSAETDRDWNIEITVGDQEPPEETGAEETQATEPEVTEPAAIKVPDVEGLPLADAMALLQGFSNVETENCYAQEDPGIVIGQSIQAGTEVMPEELIVLQVSIGPEPYDEGTYESKFPYTVNVSRSDQPIYSGPGYGYDYEGTVEIAGIYTIVDEAYDSFGNLWGELKSGAGWIDLTNVRGGSSSRVPYTITVSWSDQPIYSGPGYEYLYEGTVEIAGVYTIVEESYDGFGNLWGRLKSGAGWIDITNIYYRDTHDEADQVTLSAMYLAENTPGDNFYMDGSLVCAPSDSFQ